MKQHSQHILHIVREQDVQQEKNVGKDRIFIQHEWIGVLKVAFL